MWIPRPESASRISEAAAVGGSSVEGDEDLAPVRGSARQVRRGGPAAAAGGGRGWGWGAAARAGSAAGGGTGAGRRDRGRSAREPDREPRLGSRRRLGGRRRRTGSRRALRRGNRLGHLRRGRRRGRARRRRGGADRRGRRTGLGDRLLRRRQRARGPGRGRRVGVARGHRPNAVRPRVAHPVEAESATLREHGTDETAAGVQEHGGAVLGPARQPRAVGRVGDFLEASLRRVRRVGRPAQVRKRARLVQAVELADRAEREHERHRGAQGDDDDREPRRHRAGEGVGDSPPDRVSGGVSRALRRAVDLAAHPHLAGTARSLRTVAATLVGPAIGMRRTGDVHASIMREARGRPAAADPTYPVYLTRWSIRLRR